MLVTLQTCGAKWNSMLRPVVFMRFPSFLLYWLVTCLLYVYSHLKFNKNKLNIKTETRKHKVAGGCRLGRHGLMSPLDSLPVCWASVLHWGAGWGGEGPLDEMQGSCPHPSGKGGLAWVCDPAV